MKGHKFIGLLVLFGCLWPAGAAWAQPEQQPAWQFKFPKGKDKVRIRFKLIHNLVIIPLQINDSKLLHFVVDTGVDRTLIIETGQYDSISLLDIEYLYLRGLGQGAGIQALMSSGNRIRYAGVEVRNQEVMVLEQNIFDISSRVGMEVNGIIGYPFFKDFVVEIDYANKVLTLYKPGRYPRQRMKKGVTVPLSLENNKPYITLEAIAQDGETHEVKVVVDSGMSSSVLLYPGSLPDSMVPPTTIEAYLGRGLNGDIRGEIGRLNGLRIGGYLLENPTAAFPDSLSVRHALTLNNRNGNLGAGVLHRFRVVFDYGNATLQLLPNRKFKKPFYFNLSGMELINPLPGINVYVIADVLPNSPASRAGLKKGDNLVSINGQNCFTQTYEEVLHVLQTRPGRKLLIKVSRGAQMISTSLQLQDLI